MWGFFIFGIFQNIMYICFMSEVDYNKLRLDVLEKMIHTRGIECKMRKDEMIKMLRLDDEGKYEPPMKETTHIKDGNGFIVGIDIKNKNHLIQIGNLIVKKEARNLHRYCDDRLQYWSSQKLI